MKAFTIRIDDLRYAELRFKAAERGVSLNTYLNDLIERSFGLEILEDFPPLEAWEEDEWVGEPIHGVRCA